MRKIQIQIIAAAERIQIIGAEALGVRAGECPRRVSMNEKETAYLIKYRELLQKKKHIEGVIGCMSAICASLKDWQTTTADLGSPSPVQREWDDSPLSGLANLRTDLIVFHRAMRDLTSMWAQLGVEERIGLAAPGTLQST